MAKESHIKITPEAQARIDFARSVVPKRKRNKFIQPAITAIGVVIVALILILAISAGQHNNAKPKPTKVVSPKASALNASTPTANYTSQYFGLYLSYPKTWSLKDSGKGLLTITSPLTTLVAANGSNVKGKVTFAVNKQGVLPSGFTSGTDLAVLDSSTVTYTNPSADQSGQTYISFVQYSTTNTVGGLDGVYVTGNYGYQKDGVVPASDINGVDPLITVTFSQCASASCKTYSPLTIASTSWSGTPLGQIITSIIESFVFG